MIYTYTHTHTEYIYSGIYSLELFLFCFLNFLNLLKFKVGLLNSVSWVSSRKISLTNISIGLVDLSGREGYCLYLSYCLYFCWKF